MELLIDIFDLSTFCNEWFYIYGFNYIRLNMNSRLLYFTISKFYTMSDTLLALLTDVLKLLRSWSIFYLTHRCDINLYLKILNYEVDSNLWLFIALGGHSKTMCTILLNSSPLPHTRMSLNGQRSCYIPLWSLKHPDFISLIFKILEVQSKTKALD